MGYHSRQIAKGRLGDLSKVTEEYEELLDAHAQGNPILEMCEMADLMGAIEAYAERYGLSLVNLITMSRATKRAFEEGERK